MPKKSSEDLTKVTLNLFTSDVADFKRRYGYGWTEQMRLFIRQNCLENKRLTQTLREITYISEDMVDGEET